MIASTITLVVGATSCSFTFDPAAAQRNWICTAAVEMAAVADFAARRIGAVQSCAARLSDTCARAGYAPL
jgi:hypothetical protein